MTVSTLDFERCYRAVESRDARFDGWFITAVKTTGVYCRPSCPTPVRPKRENVRFYPTAAAAQLAGFRACKRCRPDATPGSPEWDTRADLVGRAMRLIADGVVDREGVGGLAARLGYTERHVHRTLAAVVGAGPLALARAQRAQTARVLLETTDLPITEVAFAAGFSSLRQFNATVREVFALAPRDLRRRARREPGDGAIVLRLPYRAPLEGEALVAFFARRAVRGVTRLSPSAEALAQADPARLPMPAARARALTALAAALAAGDVVLDGGADRELARRALLALPGIGPWTAEYVAMRALRDPDAFPAADLGARCALERLGADGRPAAAARMAERWRPYRAYALMHLWASLAAPAARARDLAA